MMLVPVPAPLSLLLVLATALTDPVEEEISAVCKAEENVGDKVEESSGILETELDDDENSAPAVDEGICLVTNGSELT